MNSMHLPCVIVVITNDNSLDLNLFVSNFLPLFLQDDIDVPSPFL